MAMLKLKECPFCGSEVDTVSVKEKDGNLSIEVKTKHRWIPCSEQMPESRVFVIFTVHRGRPAVGFGYRIDSERGGLALRRWFDKLSGLNFSDYDVTAWMPLPEAYELPNNQSDIISRISADWKRRHPNGVQFEYDLPEVKEHAELD